MTKHPSEEPRQPERHGDVRDLREANENIRKAQDDEETVEPPKDPKKTGNRPAFDRDR